MQFKNMIKLGLVLTLLALVGPFNTVSAQEITTDYITFTDGNQEIFTISIGPQAVQYELGGQEQVSRILFRQNQSENALYIIQENIKRAQKISEQDLEAYQRQIQAQIQQMKKMMSKLPKKQRKQMEKQLQSLQANSPDNLSSAQFQSQKSITWNDRPAKQGKIVVGNDVRVEATLLDKPLVDLNTNQRRAFDSFNELVVNWASITSNMVKNKEDIARNMIGEMYLRLARLQTDNKTIKLSDWGQRQRPASSMQLPDDYEVKSLGDLLTGNK